MEKFINYLAESFFTHLIAFGLATFGFYYSFRKAKGILRIFTLYFFSYFICQIAFFSGTFVDQSYWKIQHDISLYLDFSFTIIEYYIFVFLIWLALKEYNNFLIYLASIVFFIISFHLLYKDIQTENTLTLNTLEKVFICESLLLIVPCIVYFYHLFQNPHPIPLRNDPHFWITTGLTFFLLATLPFSLLMNSLRMENLQIYDFLYSIIYIFYCLLFTMIIKAISCRTNQTS
jgi:hypothetical protein